MPGRRSGGRYFLIAGILSMNQFPAGNSELSAKTEVLKQIRLEAAAPQEKK